MTLPPNPTLAFIQENLTHIDGLLDGPRKHQLNQCIENLHRVLLLGINFGDANALEKLERDIIACTNKIAAVFIGACIQYRLEQPDFEKIAREFITSHRKQFKSDGRRSVVIHLSNGEKITILCYYYRRKGAVKNAHRRGLYPQLCVLGIDERYSPAAVCDLGLMSTAMASLEEAVKMFEHQGHAINIKTLRRITYHLGQKARVALQQQSFKLPQDQPIKSRRIAISVDGGRIRIRKNKRGKKTKKGRNRYYTKWREPKLLHIWIINEEGTIERSINPIIDGTLKGPDAIFNYLACYLKQLDLDWFEQILFIADGAHWIWNRVTKLVKQLAIKSEKVIELLDFYHAVEHLNKLVSFKVGWSKTQKTKWLKKNKSYLIEGKHQKLVANIQLLCRGRKSKKLNTEKNYFVRNKCRMNYDCARKMKLPIGSGPMESAIRRVINLRLKGAGIFWSEQNAEVMLLLRSYYKAMRWNQLVHLANSVSLNAQI